MGITGKPRSYYKKFKFVVEIDGVKSAAFMKCSELSAEVGVVAQWEGGAVTPNKSPGRVTVSDITLERGVTNNKDLWDWFKQVIDVTSGLGEIDYKYKRNFDIVQQDRNGEPLRRYPVKGAWITKFVAGEWDNDSDENLVETVTLSIDSFDLE